MVAKINLEKRKRWEAIINEQEESGLSRKAFCENRKIPFSNFFYYQKLFQKGDRENPLGKFTSIKVSKPFNDQEIRLILPNGFQCQFPSTLESHQIKELVRALLLC